jgi:hypothetical protein
MSFDGNKKSSYGGIENDLAMRSESRWRNFSTDSSVPIRGGLQSLNHGSKDSRMGFFKKLAEAIAKAKKDRELNKFLQGIYKEMNAPLDKAEADLKRFNRPRF